ncbi:MAG: hypothetical protein F9K32_09840 [Desulfobulbaceae bacterium]|nr:MAG: hypothetical protein F9K32_09840 [Desulfobulbaceae bacterium]
MEEDERLINQAHDLFSQHSIFEIIDNEDRAEAVRAMIEIHGPMVELAKVNQYLDILDRLRG